MFWEKAVEALDSDKSAFSGQVIMRSYEKIASHNEMLSQMQIYHSECGVINKRSNKILKQVWKNVAYENKRPSLGTGAIKSQLSCHLACI